MYGQSMYRLRELEVRIDRLARVVRVADDQAADDEQAVAVQMLDGVDGRVADRAAVLAPRVLRARLEEREILVEHVLDAEEHVAESGAPHQRRQRRAVLGDAAPSSPGRCSRRR